MTQHMLTTVDNPYDPVTQFDKWDAWDQANGYHSMSFLARVVITSDELSEADQELALEQGIEEIVRENVTGMYKMVPIPDNSTSTDSKENFGST